MCALSPTALLWRQLVRLSASLLLHAFTLTQGITRVSLRFAHGASAVERQLERSEFAGRKRGGVRAQDVQARDPRCLRASFFPPGGRSGRACCEANRDAPRTASPRTRANPCLAGARCARRSSVPGFR